MTGVRKLHSGELIELRPGHARVTPDAGVSVHASETSGLGNVIPFQRPRAAESHAPDVTLPTDAARLPRTGSPASAPGSRCSRRCRSRCTLRCSCISAREPEPLASIGVEVISAEIVLGANESTGAEKDAGRGPEHQPIRRLDGPAADRAAARGRRSARPSSRRPCRSDRRRPRPSGRPRWSARPTNRRRPTTRPRRASSASRPSRSPRSRWSTSPDPEMATAAPREIPPDTMDVSLLPQPEEKPVETSEPKPAEPAETKPVEQKPVEETKPEPKPVQAAPPKPVKNAAKAKERRRIDAPTREKATREAKAPQSDPTAGGQWPWRRPLQPRHQLPRARLRAPRAPQAVSRRRAQPAATAAARPSRSA